MESQREIVEAAEALRAWVQSQRAARAGGQPPASPVAEPPPAPVAPAVPETAPAQSWSSSSTPIVFPSMPEAPAPGATPPLSIEPDVADPVTAGETTPQPSEQTPKILLQLKPTLAAWWGVALKGAAAVAVVAALVGGLMVARIKWTEYADAPQIGTATFASVPSGAEVLVDGKPAGTTPVQIELLAGAHDVELRRRGVSKTQVVNIAKGENTQVVVDWNAKPVGTLDVTSTPPGAKVLVDGRQRGVTPLTLRDLQVGAHTLVLQSAEGTIRRRFTIAEGRTETVAESIFPGWLHVSAPMDIIVSDGPRPLQLDTSNRVLLKPGVHDIRLENRALGFSMIERVEIEPGGTASVDIASPLSTLTVNGTPGATVFVDDVRAGETPLKDYQVKIGTRDVRVVAASGAMYHLAVTVTAQPAEVTVDLSRR